MESISNIKDIFNNTPENKLQMFIEQYKDDSRQGVANLVKRAAKKIDDYNKEKEEKEQRSAEISMRMQRLQAEKAEGHIN